jgi:acyl-CoA thioesterase-1
MYRLAAVLMVLAPVPPAAAEAPIKIVCLGDSVTRAVRPGVKPEETFCAVLDRRLRALGIAAEVINAGIGGHTTADGLARLDRDVLAHRPGHVVIMFGLNDSWVDPGKTTSRLSAAQYEQNLRQLLARTRAARIAPLLMTPNPVAAPGYPPERNVTLKKYVEAVREVARAEKVPLIDVYARFAELTLEGVSLNDLYTDGMHPNPRGQGILAELLARHFEVLLKR